MKKLLVIYFGDTPVCVEGFSKECKRSCEGALHLLPRKQRSITEDECAHIKKSYKHILRKFRVISEMKVPEKKEKKVAEKSKEAEVKKVEPNKEKKDEPKAEVKPSAKRGRKPSKS